MADKRTSQIDTGRLHHIGETSPLIPSNSDDSPPLEPDPIFVAPPSPPPHPPTNPTPLTVAPPPPLPLIDHHQMTSHPSSTNPPETQPHFIFHSSTTKNPHQNPSKSKIKKPKPRNQSKSAPARVRRLKERHITKHMTKEEGDYIDVDDYVPKSERNTRKRKRWVDLGKEEIGIASKGDTHAETIIPRKVQQTQPTVQHPDQENMAELWREVPVLHFLHLEVSSFGGIL
ncbi:hypothetical protein L6452_01143 [Arctium lappa]|uniref:Uncharacterized protein n=1 Tax=Arctium lappa TaxID=4217 RepID=A0ACB9FGG9_ARCLA|nr:hypothetical protein L6452_01143 [Arctium lappa]